MHMYLYTCSAVEIYMYVSMYVCIVQILYILNRFENEITTGTMPWNPSKNSQTNQTVAE